MQHAAISRARYMQENRKMRFQEAYEGWRNRRTGNYSLEQRIWWWTCRAGIAAGKVRFFPLIDG